MWHLGRRRRTAIPSSLPMRPLGKAHLAIEQGGPGGDPWCCLRPFRTAGAVPARRVGRRRCPRHAREPGLDAAARRARDVPRRAVLAGRRRAPAPGSPPRCATGCTCGSRSPRSPAPAPRGSAGRRPRRSGSSTPRPACTATSWCARTGCGPRWPGRATEPATARGPPRLRDAGLLGKAWDDELEPFRYAGDGAPVRWLHQVV